MLRPALDPKIALAEAHPPLTVHQALVEANRCLYCYDAPCTHACPTRIDIPGFIRKIANGNPAGSARTILNSNLLGATCARVCPVEELCEGACVLSKDQRPVRIGSLQRYAMDSASGREQELIRKASPTGKSVAVVGAGAAGLSCAGELLRRGHQVTLFEKRTLAGGLSTYGIIAIREPVETALAEVRMIEGLGARIETGVELGRDLDLAQLRSRFDAVFVAIGLGTTPSLGIPGEELVVDGLQYVEDSKHDGANMKVGREVVVIGAGNTAVDCATVAKRLGAERVTIVYRRSSAEMSAYPHEVAFVRREGVEFRFLAQPSRVVMTDGVIAGLACIPLAFAHGDMSGRTVVPSGEPEFIITADQIVKAIGQVKYPAPDLDREKGFIVVNQEMETSLPGVFAGGDCIRAKGSASTVMAVQDGKLAAAGIDRKLLEVARG